MEILICGNNDVCLKKTEKIVRQWGRESSKNIVLYPALSPKEALHYDDLKKFELVILETEFPEISGIELAIRLKKENPDICIIFVTEHMDFAYEAFSIKAFSCIDKKKMEKQLPEQLNRAAKEIVDSKIILEYKIRKNIYRINSNRIKYLEVMGHVISMYVQKGRNEVKIVFRDTIGALENRLPKNRFIRVNRSTIINADYIAKIWNDRILLQNGIEVPITNKYSRGVETYMDLHYK